MKNSLMLTEEQVEVYTIQDGAVVAGAGSGKTRTMVSKIIFDQDSGKVDPRDQIVVTFTNAAAREMTERLEAYGAKRPRHLGTLHSLAMRSIAQAWGEMPKVLTDAEYDALIRATLKRSRINASASDARGWILDQPRGGMPAMARKAIMNAVKASRVIHPDLMLACYLEHLKAHPETRDVQLYVDEAQDMSPIDSAIYANLSKSGKNRGSMLMFGDPRQAIYGFRGADPKIFDGHIFAYGDGIVSLTANFRSDRWIIGLANRVAEVMAIKYQRQLVAPMSLPSGEVPEDAMPIDLEGNRFATTEAEAMDIARQVKDRLADGNTVAVLSRYNAVVDVLASLLRADGINVEQPGREKPSEPSLDALRAMTTIPTDWPRALSGLSMPLALQDRLLPYLVPLDCAALIGQTVDEALDVPTDTAAVWVSTIHAAKGLEWDVVFLAGADHLSLDVGVSEDVRLVYVAVTRARRRFFCSYAKNRAGLHRVDNLSPSRILC